MSKAKRISDLQRWKLEDISDSKEWRERAKESFRFYTAIRQWLQADLNRLDDAKRPHLTIPLITSIVNTVVGFQIDNEQDFKLYPRRGGTSALAGLGSEILKHVLDNCGAHDHFTEAFQDGCIGAVGAIGIKDRQDDYNKELLVRKKSPFRVIFDQSAIEYDFDESGRRMFEETWLSEEEIELGFNKKVDDIRQSTEDPKFTEEVTYVQDDYSEEDSTGHHKMKGLFRVTKSYWRRWEKQVYLVFLGNYDKKVLHGPKMIRLAKNAMEVHNQRQSQAGAAPLMKIIERAGWKLYKTWFVGEMELSHQERPWGDISDFPVKPFYPYWADGYAFGIVEGNKDAQRYLNKMFSKEIEPNQGYYVKESSDVRAMEDLKRNGGKANFILRKDKFGGEAGRLEQPKPFFDTDLAVARLERFMNLISGQDPTLRGHKQGRGKESGKALEKRMESGIRVSKIVHKNFNRTLLKVGKFLWDAVRQQDPEGNSIYYSREEIEGIVQEQSLKQFIATGPDGQPAINLDPFYNNNIGNYGVKLVTSPKTRTVREENLEYLIRIAEVYAKLYGAPVIPPHILIKLTDVADKEEIIEYLKALPPAPQQTAQGRQPARNARTA